MHTPEQMVMRAHGTGKLQLRCGLVGKLCGCSLATGRPSSTAFRASAETSAQVAALVAALVAR